MVCWKALDGDHVFMSFDRSSENDWCISTVFVSVQESWHSWFCVGVCMCVHTHVDTVGIMTCHHCTLLLATKAALFCPGSENYRGSVARVASWNLLSNLAFWNKTHFVCLQPKMCDVRIMQWKWYLIFCRIWQWEHECKEVGGVWFCWGETERGNYAGSLLQMDRQREPGTDISRLQDINIVKAGLIPGQESWIWRGKWWYFNVPFVSCVLIMRDCTLVDQEKRPASGLSGQRDCISHN